MILEVFHGPLSLISYILKKQEAASSLSKMQKTNCRPVSQQPLQLRGFSFLSTRVCNYSSSSNKILSHYPATGHISLADCSVVSRKILIFFSKIPFSPGPVEEKKVCKYHHLHIWKLEYFDPCILYVFVFFKLTTEQ